jgi:hypothetical protein
MFQRADEMCGARGYSIVDIAETGQRIANIRPMIIHCYPLRDGLRAAIR